MLIKLLEGYGQEIYIDPEALYIKSDYINQKTKTISLPQISNPNPIYETYRNLFIKLKELEYNIITNPEEANEDTFYFSPCLDQHQNKSKEEYQNKKNNKIKTFLLEQNIKEPNTITFIDEKFPQDLPPFPFVVKNKESHGGKGKFIIKNTNQLALLKKFYNEINDYFKEQYIQKYGNAPLTFPDLKKTFQEDIVFQKYIQTPTEFNTSLRILTSSSGDILCASLKYSLPNNSNHTETNDILSDYLANPNSPYYLGNSSIISNTMAGGHSILLGKTNYAEGEKRILLAHNINPQEDKLPSEIEKAVTNIAKYCKREIGAICGLDFIFDIEENNWKFLEEHEYPMLYSYAEKYNLPQNYDNDFYNTQQLLDIQARIHALNLVMRKKQIKITRR